ncbi:MAG TPA: CPBP family intramembrane glutamic endopeptidase [Polyangiaceae bacterium]|nr:CPBP family intramembrane glutamic endopeptidase [Polyangiaceae bacterium]
MSTRPGWASGLLWTAGAHVALELVIGLLALRAHALDLVSLGAAEALVYTVTIGIFLWLYERGTPLRAALGLRPTHVGLALVGIGLGSSLKLPAEALTNLVERVFPLDDAHLLARAALYRANGLGDVVRLCSVTCLLAPLVEELFFRGALYGRLTKSSALGAALVTGIAFVVVHADPRHWPALCIVAAVLGFLRSMSGSLLPCLGLHVAFNAAGVLALVTGAASPTRPLSVSRIALSLSWLVAALLLWLTMRLAADPHAARARAEDRA